MSVSKAKAWEAAFDKLHRWLECCPYREVGIKPDDKGERWQVFLYEEGEIVEVAIGVDLPSAVSEVMIGHEVGVNPPPTKG